MKQIMPLSIMLLFLFQDIQAQEKPTVVVKNNLPTTEIINRLLLFTIDNKGEIIGFTGSIYP